MFVFGGYLNDKSPTLDEIPNETDNETQYSDWVRNLCAENSWLVKIPNSYILDSFNCNGISDLFENFTTIHKIIRGLKPGKKDKQLDESIYTEAQSLYFLLHARYIVTYPGAKDMKAKFDSALFGKCPRVRCKNTHLLPIGLSPVLKQEPVKLFCVSCKDIFDSQEPYDGACFGPYFPTFLQQVLYFESTFPDCEKKSLSFNGIPYEEAEDNQCN